MKCLRVTQIVTEIKFEGVWGKLESKKTSRDNKSFLLVSIKFLFWQKDWALGYHSMKFRNFSDIV